MKKANDKGNVNIFMVFRNFAGDVTAEELIATFRNEKWATDFLKTANANGNYDDYCYLDMRTV